MLIPIFYGNDMEIRMSVLFSPAKIGNLELPNRLIRSATAECMASDDNGAPREQLKALWVELAKGGVGLIITGHMYVHPSGKAHPEMMGIYSDDLVPGLMDCVDAVHSAGGKIAAQINHGGMHSPKKYVGEAIAPSVIDDEDLEQPPRAMTGAEIEMLIDAYGQAARRAQEAGFDALQVHAAHGYLINQFVSPYTNRREDQWGVDQDGRTRFLREVMQAVRKQVGPDYPVFVKFGMRDGKDDGLTAEAGAKVIGLMAAMGLDGVEISGGVNETSVRKGIKSPAKEAYFRPLALLAREKTDLPIILVGGIRSKAVMEDVLSSGDADFVALCRPLIREPDFPNRMKIGKQEISACISSSNCWAEKVGDGIACKCPPMKS
jgi:2,4-dienoyl-CoA reductase-like NADH-dependent reductase (Old Yellow Enzyme family)